MRASAVLACSLVLTLSVASAQSPREPTLDTVLDRMSRYVAAYGAQASMFVGREDYTQQLASGARRLVSEFAIVRAGAGESWAGYRDVVEADGKPVPDRQDRLLRLFSAESVTITQLRQIDSESARYNVGPISRNFNVPTTALFFFDPRTVKRFSFERKGVREIDGVTIWELEFREKVRPTLVRTPGGRDVRSSGRVWVVVDTGVIVRTRLELRGFAEDAGTRAASTTRPSLPTGRSVDTVTSAGVVSAAPAAAPPIETGGASVESVAQIEVVYRLDPKFGTWLPLKMSEWYQGPRGRATGVAEYAAFKRFETSARIVIPK
jgi:hypothetical protein